MSTLQQSKNKKGYNPFKVRRHVRLDVLTDDRVAIFKSKSMTDETDNSDRYHPAINLETGEWRCECRHFEIRLTHLRPTIWSDASQLCKHILRAITNLQKRGELPEQSDSVSGVCTHCGAEAECEEVDATGNVVIGRICRDCIDTRMDDLSTPVALPAHPVADRRAAPGLLDRQRLPRVVARLRLSPEPSATEPRLR